MPIPSEQPRFDQPVVDSSGRATQPWMNYWLLMPSQASLDAVTGRVDIIERQIQDIEGDESSSTFKLLGNLSIAVVGMPNPGGVVLLSLLNDVQAPAATSYYGTDASGAKGWFLVESTVQAASGELTKTVDAEGVSTFGLSDLANAGTGSLLAFTRDGKGRVTGTKAATITGTTNQINVANGDAAAGLPTLSLAAAVIASLGKADSAVQSIVAGTGITVDNTDPRNPIVATTGGGGAVTSVNARTGVVAVPDFVVKATAPVDADFGRPIIEGDRWFNASNGVTYTYVDGGWVYDNAASLSRYVPFLLVDGSSSPIPLNADGTIPFILQNGTPSNIPTQA